MRTLNQQLAAWTFTDVGGAEWTVRLTMDAVIRIRDRTGYCFLSRTDRCRTLGELIDVLPVTDVDDFLQVLHAAVRPTAADRGLLAAEDFAARFDMSALVRASSAFVAAAFESLVAAAERPGLRRQLADWRAEYEARCGASLTGVAPAGEGV